jgi:putative transposase
VHLELAQDKLRLADEQFWREFGGAEMWREPLMSLEELSELRWLRRCTFAGRPYGSERVLPRMEDRFGRRWRRWSFKNASDKPLEHTMSALDG